MHIVTGEEMNEIDRCTTQKIGLAGPMLMENAGQAVARKLFEWMGSKDRVAVMIGTGNNGGDGFVIARVLLDKGYDVDVWLVPPREKIKGDAKTHFDIFEAAGYRIVDYELYKEKFRGRLNRYTVIVDALLGTGVKGEVRAPYKEMIAEVNNSKAFVVSVDLPSGVPANGGEVSGVAIKADRTVTLACPKTGALMYPSADYYGQWETVDIGIPRKVIKETTAPRRLWLAKDVKRTFPDRLASSHKGTYGRGLVVAGSESMTGAAVMTTRATLRGGGGLITAAIPGAIHPVVASQVTEATYHLCPAEAGSFAGEMPFDLTYDGVAVGPGIGRGQGAERVVESLLHECQAPLIIDADGLFHLERLKPLLAERKVPTVLTPHPGEMASLAGISVSDVQNHRFEVAYDFASEHGVFLVLKGPYTIVTTPEGKQYVNPTGNPALAKGGTGDVLTGLILAFMMQHKQVQPAVSNAVYLHGRTADDLIRRQHSSIDVLATDIIESFGHTMHDFLADEAD